MESMRGIKNLLPLFLLELFIEQVNELIKGVQALGQPHRPMLIQISPTLYVSANHITELYFNSDGVYLHLANSDQPAVIADKGLITQLCQQLNVNQTPVTD